MKPRRLIPKSSRLVHRLNNFRIAGLIWPIISRYRVKLATLSNLIHTRNIPKYRPFSKDDVKASRIHYSYVNSHNITSLCRIVLVFYDAENAGEHDWNRTVVIYNSLCKRVTSLGNLNKSTSYRSSIPRDLTTCLATATAKCTYCTNIATLISFSARKYKALYFENFTIDLVF